MAMLLLKTDDKNITGVRKHAKHATDDCPRDIVPGDTLLIQVTYASMAVPVSRVKYKMTFVRCYHDSSGESQKIWGRSWRYIIEGENLCTLRYPFDIESVKVSNKNYGQGVIRYAYLDAADEATIRGGGHLQCV